MVQSRDIPFGPRFVQRVRFTSDVWNPANGTLAAVLEPREDGPAPVLVFIDDGVERASPGCTDRVHAYLKASGGRVREVGPAVLVPGGERAKNDRVELDRAVEAIHAAKLCRRSYVLVIGGGAVLDVIGLAAALAHRGVRLVRVPTTTLAQADSGVAVKNGINAFGKKNYLGVFAPAWAVVNDAAALRTLSERDWRCGFAEAVKVAVIKDAPFFEQIEADTERIAAREEGPSGACIQRSCMLHLRHITDGGDPFELTHARPLDFGHWAAHRLESLTGYELRHGEAVAIGIAVDVRYAVLSGLLSESDGARIVSCLERLGFSLGHPALGDVAGVLQGLQEFREHLGGELTVTLPRKIGESRDVHEVDLALMRKAMEQVRARRPSENATGLVMGKDRPQPPHMPVYT